jgi:hypothetical protein
MSWHAGTELVTAYLAGRLSPAHAASVEAHVMVCEDCRATLADATDAARRRRNWEAIEKSIDQPHRSIVERLLVHIGLREHDARLVAGAPVLRPAWLMAIAAVLTSAVLLESASEGSGAWFYFFLIIVPVLPVVGVAAAFQPGADPARELVVAAPKPTLELLLARAVSVLGVTVLLTAVAALALPERGWSATVWLLPALGLAAATMALATWLPAHWGATGLAVLWIVAATLNYRAARVGNEAIERFVAFQPVGQVGFSLLTAAAAIVLTLRSSAVELGRIQ